MEKTKKGKKDTKFLFLTILIIAIGILIWFVTELEKLAYF